MRSVCSLRSLIGPRSYSYLPSSRYAAGCSDHVIRGERGKTIVHSSVNCGINQRLFAAKENVSTPYALSFQSFIHSTGQRDDDPIRNFTPGGFMRDVGMERNSTLMDSARDGEMGRNSTPIRSAKDGEMGRNSTPIGSARDGEMGRNSTPIGSARDGEMGRNSTPIVSARYGEMGWNSTPIGSARDGEMGRNSRLFDIVRGMEVTRNSRPMDFVKGVLKQDNSRTSRYKVVQNPDFVLINLKRNNSFINVLDSKGNTKFRASSGFNAVGGGKVTRYAAEATAEFVGRKAREMGLKSVVMRVKGFTYFKRKRQAIMSFREGFSNSRSDQNPIVCIEDVTQRPHNGCRLPKKRRI